MPSVGLALIAKNEEKRLPTLLKSIEGAFDQVVLVDTGSTDRTKQVFETWARHQDGLEWTTGYFHWTKDFSAARRHAQSLLDTDWEVWADCDDVIVGAQNIRQVISQAPEHVAGFLAGYNYAQHPVTGQCICYLRRERIMRKGQGRWMNRVHEAQVMDGPMMQLDPSTVEWVHQKQYRTVEEMKADDARRNLDILDAWVEDEPENTRVLAYLGTEYAAQGEHDTAIEWFTKYFMANPDWDEERAQVHRKLAMCLLITDRFDEAINQAFEAIRVLPKWTDSYVTLAEAYLGKGDFDKSLQWAEEAARRGQPDTLLIINPLDYTFQPLKVAAAALAGLKRYEEAVDRGSQAWQLNPMDEPLAAALNVWRMEAKKDRTANTFAAMAQQLVAHDEQLKALTLLEECVPHFVQHHPGIVNLRSELRQRLDWVNNPRSLLEHYAEGGSKPEDFLDEEVIDDVAGRLPRTRFLYAGIHEQMIESHEDGIIVEALEQAGLMKRARAEA